jgi:hypothetical protein
MSKTAEHLTAPLRRRVPVFGPMTTRRPGPPPTYNQLLAAIDRTDQELSALFGQWDTVPTPVREALRAIDAPLLDLLLRTSENRRVAARRSGQQRWGTRST